MVELPSLEVFKRHVDVVHRGSNPADLLAFRPLFTMVTKIFWQWSEEPMPASSKMNPPLAKAEPISNSGRASVITYLRRGKSCCSTATAAEERRICERNNSADTKGSEEGGGGGAPDARADIHLQPMEDPTLEQVDAQRRL
ncbi:hypothetical protein QYF61_020068 [Mycteria americana]|uniref:Uncharacterized protein n=1 Tax=Mycteria americana TaxID=33587 RepID=A0AAN7N309_MYCAM|nr:hypothetical protein QYF61_020068 [Mycteria americana]